MRGEQADAIRKHVSEAYIAPARKEGLQSVTIKIGEIHGELGYYNKLALICSSLRAAKFREENNLELISRSGPHESSSTVFTFKLL
jgi:hypothetical protein